MYLYDNDPRAPRDEERAWADLPRALEGLKAWEAGEGVRLVLIGPGGNSPGPAADAAWERVVAIAEANRWIVQAFAGTMTLALRARQRSAGICCVVQAASRDRSQRHCWVCGRDFLRLPS